MIAGSGSLDDRRLLAVGQDQASFEPESERTVFLRLERPFEELALEPEPEQKLAADEAAKLDLVEQVHPIACGGHSSSAASSLASTSSSSATPDSSRIVSSSSCHARCSAGDSPRRAASV